MDHGTLPSDVQLVRTTDAFDHDSVPPGLLRAHHVAAGVHGRVRVLAGHMRFVWEDDEGGTSVALAAGDTLVIPPLVRHHVELDPGARFVVEFHR